MCYIENELIQSRDIDDLREIVVFSLLQLKSYKK